MKIYTRLQRPAGRVFIAVVLALAGLAPGAAAPRAARAAGPYVVDTLVDGDDTNVFNGSCLSTEGGCSLRAAIAQASYSGVPTTITFDSDLLGGTVVLSATLGTLVWFGNNITVTGGILDIKVSGANLSGDTALVAILGNDNMLADLTLEDGPASGVLVEDPFATGVGNDNTFDSLILIGNAGPGITLRGSPGGGARGNHILNSFIGLTDPSIPVCSPINGNNTGVFIERQAISTEVHNNFIGCNGFDGVDIDGALGSPLGTLVTGNRIGTNSAGDDLGNSWAGVAIYNDARDVTVTNNTLSGNGLDGLYIAGADTRQITVTENQIGTNPAGLAAVGNGLDGISITGVDSARTTIDNNVISGNLGPGVVITSSSGVTLSNNLIGLDAAGSGIVFNDGNGVELRAATHNLIEANFISANAGVGVLLEGADTALNRVSANTIGLNAAGDAELHNNSHGVLLSGGAHDNTIGGAANLLWRNVISGNDGAGVKLEGGAHHNSVDGNLIGLDAAGGAALGNGLAGVYLVGAPDNAISSLAAVVPQLISGNDGEGIRVSTSSGTTIGPMAGIGVCIGCGLTTLGNGADGIFLADVDNSRVSPGVVAYNGGAGINVAGDGAGAKIAPLGVFSNAGLPIDLSGDGHTPNDPGDADGGPNALQNYPVMTAQAGSVVTGTVCANCRVFIYKAIGNPAAGGGGGTYVGETVANGAGVWVYSGLPAGVHATDISMAACAGPCTVAGNTSEMSPRFRLSLPLVLR